MHKVQRLQLILAATARAQVPPAGPTVRTPSTAPPAPTRPAIEQTAVGELVRGEIAIARTNCALGRLRVFTKKTS